MKFCIVLLQFAILLSCQTAKVKTTTYDSSQATVELGAIGHSKSYAAEKDFSTRIYPLLKNKVRVDIQILPLTKKLNKLFESKRRFDQSKPASTYVDSLASKPEYIVISILDVGAYLSAINEDAQSVEFLKNTQLSSTISSVALTVDVADVMKIRGSDAYYLVNKYDSKYSVALFKNGKQTEILHFNPSNVLAYKLGYFCWVEDQKRGWKIADMIDRPDKCKGKTMRFIKKDADTDLFRM